MMDSLQEILNTVQNGLSNKDPTIIGILVAVIVIFLTIVVLVIRGSTNKRTGILLVGMCDAGKTLIYSRLVYKKFVQTHTSTKENIGTYVLQGEKSGKSLQVFDLPGHDRLRYHALDNVKSLARGIVFVVDSSTFQKEIKDVAEFLYTILTDRVVSHCAPPVLVACNKSDQLVAKGAKLIQAQLEKEMNTLRVTKSAVLGGSDSVGNNNTYLGKRGKDFSFADLKPYKIEFTECSARGLKDEGECDLDGLLEWLTKIA